MEHAFCKRMIPRRVDNMEAVLLPDERTDLVSTNRLGHGWANQKLANQQAIFRAGCKSVCDWLPAYELQRPKRCAELIDEKA